MRTRPPALVLAVATTLLTGACTVSSPSAPTSASEQQTLQRFRKDLAVRYDLTVPRTAQELGVAAGYTSALFDRDGSEYWTVTLVLPGGREFVTSRASRVGVFIPDEPGGLLNSVTVNARVVDLDALLVELNAAVDQLGLDRAEVARFVAEQRRNPVSVSNPVNHQVLSGTPLGHLTTNVEPRVTRNDDGVAVNYTFTWEPRAASAVAGTAAGASQR
ncbi:MAG TPA: hypothetical protein VFR07_19520 [Mycobacteriales bacterium]|nr:hypothetical protein [Mycobacteriales bacterium]